MHVVVWEENQVMKNKLESVKHDNYKLSQCRLKFRRWGQKAELSGGIVKKFLITNLRHPITKHLCNAIISHGTFLHSLQSCMVITGNLVHLMHALTAATYLPSSTLPIRRSKHWKRTTRVKWWPGSCTGLWFRYSMWPNFSPIWFYFGMTGGEPENEWCRLPLYYEFKLLFVLWLILPQTRGHLHIYRSLVYPNLVRHEVSIDELLKNAGAKVTEISAEIGRQGLEMIQRVTIESLTKVSLFDASMISRMNQVHGIDLFRCRPPVPRPFIHCPKWVTKCNPTPPPSHFDIKIWQRANWKGRLTLQLQSSPPLLHRPISILDMMRTVPMNHLGDWARKMRCWRGWTIPSMTLISWCFNYKLNANASKSRSERYTPPHNENYLASMLDENEPWVVLNAIRCWWLNHFDSQLMAKTRLNK